MPALKPEYEGGNAGRWVFCLFLLALVGGLLLAFLSEASPGNAPLWQKLLWQIREGR